MSILKNLFGGKPRNKTAVVKGWIEEQVNRRHDPSDQLSIDALLVSIMVFVHGFASLATDGEKLKDHDFPFANIYDKYINDAALFEVGCYAMFHVDLWLFENEPERRSSISNPLFDKFVDLFERILNTKDIGDIFGQRLAGYGQLVRSKAEYERYNFYLSQVILRCKNNKPVASYHFEDFSGNSPILIVGALDDAGLKTLIVIWEKSFLPRLIDTFKWYCDNA